MSNVAAFPGYSVQSAQNEPVAEVIEICEELLALAQTGKLRAIAAGLVLGDLQLLTDTRLFSRPSPDRYAVIAAVAHLSALKAKTAWPDL